MALTHLQGIVDRFRRRFAGSPFSVDTELQTTHESIHCLNLWLIHPRLVARDRSSQVDTLLASPTLSTALPEIGDCMTVAILQHLTHRSSVMAECYFAWRLPSCPVLSITRKAKNHDNAVDHEFQS